VAAQIDRGSTTARAAGQHQALYREVNERIRDLVEHLDLGDAIPLLCECGSGGCDGRVEVTRAEYERLRRHPNRFAVSPGHQIPGRDRVVEEHERYHVVEPEDEAPTG